ncbi:hypothetical protein [Microbulbifer sp. Q7]|nr:hypothetical protein [Microbulbifer sp. Q7]
MENNHSPEIEKIIKSAAPFVEIRSLGGYEEPEWVVRPSVAE